MVDAALQSVDSGSDEWLAQPLKNVSLRQARSAYAEAAGQGLRRLLQALFREGLLDEAQLIFDHNDAAWLANWKGRELFRFEGLKKGGAGSWQLHGKMSYLKNHAAPCQIETAAVALTLLAPLFDLAASTQDVERLQAELRNSTENDALCIAYRQTWQVKLAQEITRNKVAGLIALQQKKTHEGKQESSPENGCLLLEQWGTLGHPWHPNYKTKLGLTPQDVVALSPEFEANIQLCFAAVRAKVMHVECMVGLPSELSSYLAWFEKHYPVVWKNWLTALERRHLQAQDWLPLPIHPWQNSACIPHEFSDEIARGNVILLDDVTQMASPTMSFRTVVPDRSCTAPLMKLPVCLRLTSVQRTVSPKSAQMGPRISTLLEKILAQENGFDATLSIIQEQVGVHYINNQRNNQQNNQRDPNNSDDRARHLSVLYRANPMSHADGGLFPVPVGALFSSSPLDGRPLVTELVARAFDDDASGAIVFYGRYAEITVQATLSAYLLYGIGFEAHQQNSFMLIDEHGLPQRLLLRDFGDIRIHADALAASGFGLQCYQAGQTVVADRQQVRDKLLHAVFLCHLGELALLLTQTYRLPEAQLWQIFRTTVDAIFQKLKPRVPAELWDAEYDFLMVQKWPAKLFMRMRLSDSADDAIGTMENPLAASVMEGSDSE